MDYPKKRTVRWVDDETDEEVGSCEYIRTDLYNELLRAADEVAGTAVDVDESRGKVWSQEAIDRMMIAVAYYRKAKETTND